MTVRRSSLLRACRGLLCLAAALHLALLPLTAAAQRRQISIVRDAEIESTIRFYASPLLGAAGLDSGKVQVHLVNDRSLNAFVANGQRIFVHTGLLIKAQSPGQVIGVLAHEIGHIAGGHLARLEDSLSNASTMMIAAMLLGAAAGAVSGSGDVMVAGALAGQQLAERSFLQYTRGQESAADQAGANFLEASGQSISGLAGFMKVLANQEALVAERQDPYVRTHPLSSERVSALNARNDQSRFRDKPESPEQVERFKRMQAKLIGYLESVPMVLRQYPSSDGSLYGRYARAHAYFRALEFDKALAEIDSLINEWPNDPYFEELKGDILINMARVREALAPMQRARDLAPNEPLLAYGLARAQIALEDPAMLPDAIKLLEDALRQEPDNPGAWQQLAIAHGRNGDIGKAALASAERFLLVGQLRDALGQAERASRLMKEGSPGWLRAQDIAAAAKDQRREQRGGRF